MDSEPKFLDGESSWGGKRDGGSFNEIMYRQLERITRLASVEFHGGYWQKKPISGNTGTILMEYYVEDTAAAYCNAVGVLFDILFAYFDGDMKKIIPL